MVNGPLIRSPPAAQSPDHFRPTRLKRPRTRDGGKDSSCASGECAALGITKSELAMANVLATKSTGMIIICVCGGHVRVCQHRVLYLNLKLLVVQAIRMVFRWPLPCWALCRSSRLRP